MASGQLPNLVSRAALVTAVSSRTLYFRVRPKSNRHGEEIVLFESHTSHKSERGLRWETSAARNTFAFEH
jgi:hypothetical protein